MVNELVDADLREQVANASRVLYGRQAAAANIGANNVSVVREARGMEYKDGIWHQVFFALFRTALCARTAIFCDNGFAEKAAAPGKSRLKMGT